MDLVVSPSAVDKVDTVKVPAPPMTTLKRATSVKLTKETKVFFSSISYRNKTVTLGPEDRGRHCSQ